MTDTSEDYTGWIGQTEIVEDDISPVPALAAAATSVGRLRFSTWHHSALLGCPLMAVSSWRPRVPMARRR